ncbi:breast cancer protein [Xylariaceae sp. FL0804]|nr:breast cancer protein [Xylariaceae sp. FL0804]
MSRLGGWLRGSTSKTSVNPSPPATQADSRANALSQLEEAMVSASMIMNDDIDGAEEGLKKGDSTFHSLGMGVCIFMRSILGVEKSIMLEASNRLSECENSAWAEMRKAQKDADRVDKVYPPGSEWTLVHSEAQLMLAVVAVLHESLTEGIKGFYKLRKAYLALDGIMEAERTYLESNGLALSQTKSLVSHPSMDKSGGPVGDDADEDDDLEFVDADEAHSGAQTPLSYEGHINGVTDAEKKMDALTLDKSEELSATVPEKAPSPSAPAKAAFEGGPDSEIFSDPMDVFVHSGANMCFGVLLVMISMVPPAFSRLLSIIGFRGDRERGIKMLWQSSRFDNINGAVSALVLLAYYNGFLGAADILPTEEDTERGAISGKPTAKCTALLAKMRSRYPDSGLWRFEEARNLVNSKDIYGAIAILKANKSKMRQVSALNSFELSLDCMYVQDHEGTRDNFIRCVELNEWSHALYYYIAGCAELELYRLAYHAEKKDDAQITLHKKKADELLRKAPTVAGKRRFMSKPLPFEEFVSRKIKKWEERSKALGIDLVDVVGASPTQEMVYLWNGVKRMAPPELEKANAALSWDCLTAPAEAQSKIRAEPDEQAVHDVCSASIFRALGQFKQARSLLEEVLQMDKLALKGPLRDDYALPAAHYEMAVLSWMEMRQQTEAGAAAGAGTAAASGTDESWMKKKIDECESWLDKVSKWEAYVLDARFGIRVQMSMDTIKWYRREYAWAAAA